MPDNVLNTKADVLGVVTKSKATGDYYITGDLVRTPLAYPGTVIRCFCLGCGHSTELTPEGAQKLLEMANKQAPDSWQGFYFESRRCIVCGDDYRHVVLNTVA